MSYDSVVDYLEKYNKDLISRISCLENEREKAIFENQGNCMLVDACGIRSMFDLARIGKTIENRPR